MVSLNQLTRYHCTTALSQHYPMAKEFQVTFERNIKKKVAMENENRKENFRHYATRENFPLMTLENFEGKINFKWKLELLKLIVMNVKSDFVR